MPADPVALSVFNSLLASIAEEMGAALIRSSLSPNIRERRDLSCAVFDAAGNLVAQAAHIPVHLGAMPASVEAVQPLQPLAPGDIVVLNDPYLGGSHLPDVTMVSPVFTDAPSRRLLGYVASRAHQSDIGGMARQSSWMLWLAMPSCFRLLAQRIRLAASRTFWTAGSKSAIRSEMMAMTTSSSMSVKAVRRWRAIMEAPPRRQNGWRQRRVIILINSVPQDGLPG